MPALESSYTRVRELGRGGMGVVTLARQHSLGRMVALKELLVDGDLDPLLKRFAREAAALAKLSHPNVVRLLDFDMTHDPAYLVCEYVEGAVPLSELLMKRPPGREQALALAREIAAALAHVHAEGLMHRDLKPANVLVDGEGQARLIDFGLARTVTPEESRLTQTGHLIGTFTYMAPEQMDRVEADARADVYAFGLVLYELLAGELVFAAGAPRHVSPGQRWAGQVPDLSTRAPGVPPELAEVVAKCLALDPGERYPNGAALARALAPRRRLEPNDPPENRALIAAAVVGALVTGVVIGRWGRPEPVVVAASVAPATPAAEVDLLALARDAEALEPCAVVVDGRKRVRTGVELGHLRTEAIARFSRLLDGAAAVLDSESAPVESKRAVYAGLARLRLLDRVLTLNGLPRIEVDRALGQTFAPGVPAWLDLLVHGQGLAGAQLKFRQAGVELPGYVKEIIEVATEGQERVTVDLATPPSSLRWAAVHLKTPRLGRRDILWVSVNGVPLMLDDRCVAAHRGIDWVISHFLDPRMLRMTGNMITVTHEVLPGEGSASIMRLSTQVGIAGSVKPLAP